MAILYFIGYPAILVAERERGREEERKRETDKEGERDRERERDKEVKIIDKFTLAVNEIENGDRFLSFSGFSFLSICTTFATMDNKCCL